MKYLLQMTRISAVLFLVILPAMCLAQSRDNQTVDGYRGIWFALGQVSAYGDKYSGGLGTYTAHHSPLAIYAPAVKKTFFVYGGTTGPNDKHLLCMIGSFDHRKMTVSRPVVVCDKQGVDDPHDNPSLMIDDNGFIWVYVSGRGVRRMGYKYRSVRPYDISAFEQIREEEMTYPQPIFAEDKGYFHFFTKYTGFRELYFEKSTDGIHWTEDVKLAGIRSPADSRAGHYQVSNHRGNWLFTFFNWHPDGNVDKRTNVYYVETRDFGEHFQSADGQDLMIPLEDIASPARVLDYHSRRKNVYLCDAEADVDGNPVCLYVISDGHEPGPANGPREWMILFRRGGQWVERKVAESDHNYDMGSLFLDAKRWRIVAPTDDGPQPQGAGGEVVIWQSKDEGMTWERGKQVTANSARNHNYVRRVVNGRPPFMFLWADGNPDAFSESHLFIGDLKGNVYPLPYTMRGAEERLSKMR